MKKNLHLLPSTNIKFNIFFDTLRLIMFIFLFGFSSDSFGFSFNNLIQEEVITNSGVITKQNNLINTSAGLTFAVTPTFVSFSPADNATGVAVNTNLIITFSANVTIGTGNITIIETGVGTDQTIDVTDITQVTISNNVVTINPTNNLSPNSEYHINFPSTAFEGSGGSQGLGINDATTWNFNTCTCSPLCSFLPTAAGTYTATNSVTDGAGYTHYCDGLGQLLLSVKVPGGATIPNSAVSLRISNPSVLFESQFCGGTGNGCFVINPLGTPLLQRQWYIDEGSTSNIPAFTNFNIIYYFTQADFTALQASATSNSSTPLSTHTDLELYKILDFGGIYGNFPMPSSINNWWEASTIKYGGASGSPSPILWKESTYTGATTGGLGAEFQINNLKGGGGIGGEINNQN